jgi:acyl-CoA synthetase (NDP forming)
VQLHPLFAPQNLAVIGLSLSNHHHPANVIYTKNKLRYPVDVFAVNPKGGSLFGDTVYTNVKEIQEDVDLALIAVKAEHVRQSVIDCIEAGIKGAVVISGGFAESGRPDLQEDIARLAERHEFPIIGPNCLGLYKPGQVDTFFLPSERMIRPESGDVAVISQSGGVLVDQLVKFSQQGVGISLAVSIGNKALIGELELLDYLAKDPATNVVALYLEGFRKNEGRRFVQAAAACGKPVVVLKAGKSSGGNRAVSSHTASLAGDYRVFSQIMAQHGIAEAANEFEMLSFCEALSCYTGPIQGNVGIVTGSGGHGALCVDVCEKQGLNVPSLGPESRERITAGLSPSIQSIASLDNPVDLTGSAVDADFIATVSELAAAPELDCILVLMLPYLPGISSDLAARLSQISRNFGKPVIAYVPHVEKFGMFIEGFEYNRIPVSSSIEGAVLMAEALRRCRLSC